ncbi:hypothetical protein AGMMS49983_10530 [Clostridia bacterium]|nr:hypothetical protein AGMMS49983_10530 [Clostridia bacterium]
MRDKMTEDEEKQHQIEIKKRNRRITQLESIIERNRLAQLARSGLEELRKAEQDQLHRYMDLLLDNNPNIILLLDAELHLQFCTDVFLKKLRLPSFDMIRNLSCREVFMLFAEEAWVSSMEQSLRHAVSGKTPVTVEKTADIDDDGEPNYYKISITPMVDLNGKAEGAIVIFNDITEEKNAREAAVRASSAKSDFLANMSHEMRTPMNAIIGMTSIALGSDDALRKNYCLGKISDAATHLLGIINDVLDISKIEANMLELSEHDFSFEKMMQKIATVLAFTMDAKNIDFRVRIDPSVPDAIRADEQRMSQVITNFLSNAAKFTPEGGRVLLAASRAGTDADKEIDFIRISVSDTGIGISEEFMPRLFNSFEQADNSVSRKYGGTGLGLAISKKIVELMGGTLNVDSVAGEGSTFSFVVGVKKARAFGGQSLPQNVNWVNLRVLAVDDSAEARMHFDATAEALDFACDTAKDAREALEMIERADPGYDIIFADWKMPGMDGLEFAKEIKRRGAGHAVVVMISSSEWSEIADRAKEAGVDGFIPKPLFTSALTDMINNLMAQPGDESEVGSEESEHEFEGVHILLVEDVDINREIVESLFEETGAIITSAENGLEAVEKFAETPGLYDVIFMDIHMPVKDGYAAAREIRAMDIPRAKTIPIIAMTANVFKKDVDKCLACGMNDHVGKPIDIEEVFVKLRRQLRMSVRS